MFSCGKMCFLMVQNARALSRSITSCENTPFLGKCGRINPRIPPLKKEMIIYIYIYNRVFFQDDDFREFVLVSQNIVIFVHWKWSKTLSKALRTCQHTSQSLLESIIQFLEAFLTHLIVLFIDENTKIQFTKKAFFKMTLVRRFSIRIGL